MTQAGEAQRLHALDKSALELFAESASDVMVWVGPDGGVLFVSPSVRRYGYQPSDIVGTDGAQLFHPDDRQRLIVNASALRRGELHKDANRRLRFLTRSGDCVWVEGNPRPIADSAGAPLGFLNVFRDITEQCRLEAAARDQQDLLGAVFDHSAIGKVVLDMGGRIIRVNRSIAQTLGYLSEELIGRSDDDFAHPDEIGRFSAQLASIAGGEIDSYQVERRYRSRSGTWTWFSLSVSMARNPDGSPRAIVAELEDLTERRASEDAVAESEARYRMLAENTIDVIVRYDLTGTIDFVSPAIRLLGYEPEQLVGHKVAEFLHPDDVAEAQGARSIALSGQAGPRVDARVRRADGGWTWMEGGPLPIRNRAGAVIGAFSVMRDVTARRALEEELRGKRAEAEAAAVAKSEFLANMSHEIRTPLTGILGFASLLEGLEGLPSKANTYVSRIVASGRALLSVVNDILDFSKLDADRLELDPHPFDPNALVAETLALVSAEAARKGLHLHAADPGALPAAVLADSARLRQVLLNLLANAIKFTDRGGVTVAARYLPDEARLHISVIDTGMGIPVERRGRLFQRFSQVDGSTTREYGGTGLGLAICKRLTEMMGGEIGLETGEGEGSIFWFTVDAPRAELEAAPPPSDADTNLELGGARILLVDDVAMNRELVRTMLSPFGYDLVEAASGAEAVAAAMAGRFDLILMDLQMPGMDGLAATRAIRQTSQANHDTPILALSANVLPVHLSECADAGMNDHIGKPIAPADLLTKIAQWANVDRSAETATT